MLQLTHLYEVFVCKILIFMHAHMCYAFMSVQKCAQVPGVPEEGALGRPGGRWEGWEVLEPEPPCEALRTSVFTAGQQLSAVAGGRGGHRLPHVAAGVPPRPL